MNDDSERPDIPFDCEMDIGPYGVGVKVGNDFSHGVWLDREDIEKMLAAVIAREALEAGDE